jgi:hypothetical protein
MLQNQERHAVSMACSIAKNHNQPNVNPYASISKFDIG